jgi:hypothetical protein
MLLFLKALIKEVQSYTYFVYFSYYIDCRETRSNMPPYYYTTLYIILYNIIVTRRGVICIKDMKNHSIIILNNKNFMPEYILDNKYLVCMTERNGF